jgi:hypothetical protein
LEPPQDSRANQASMTSDVDFGRFIHNVRDLRFERRLHSTIFQRPRQRNDLYSVTSATLYAA